MRGGGLVRQAVDERGRGGLVARVGGVGEVIVVVGGMDEFRQLT